MLPAHPGQDQVTPPPSETRATKVIVCPAFTAGGDDGVITIWAVAGIAAVSRRSSDNSRRSFIRLRVLLVIFQSNADQLRIAFEVSRFCVARPRAMRFSGGMSQANENRNLHFPSRLQATLIL